MKTFPISIQMYTLRTLIDDDPQPVLERLAQIGYAAVEPAGFYGISPREYRRRVEDLGMKIGSSHTPWGNAVSVAEGVDIAGELGLDKIALGYGREAFANKAAIKKTAEQAKELMAAYQKQGIGVFMHNHWWEFEEVDGRLAIEHFLEDCPGMAFEMDVYWVSNFGRNDVPELIEKFRGRTPLLHVKDGPLEREAANVALGEGKMDITACVHAANPNKLEYLVFEMDHCDTDHLDAAEKSFRFLVDQDLGRGKA